MVRIASQPVQKGGVGEAEAKVEAKWEAEAKGGRHNENHQHPGHQHQGHQRQGHPQPQSQNQRHQHQGYHDQPQKRKNQQERRSSQNHQPQSKKPHGRHQCHMLAARDCMMLSGSMKFANIVKGLQASTHFT